ncbi:2,3-diketo-5-methylthio-1-phosphopentane phosphatase [Synechococcus sp. WH 7805]|nr:2,3-diketo-5-methylthio-1-phosphopentane phosphatase [Synechococcus sp. WH 7805]
MIEAIVLDIEGTTCPVNFVSQTLFPFARRQLTQTICAQNRKASVLAAIQEAISEWKKDTDPTSQALLLQATSQNSPTEEEVVRYFEHLIECDRKSTALKELQGIIWEQGYASGELQSPLYPDVIPALDTWKQKGLTLAVYSSGSVKAQQLLYSHTTNGDITDRFSQWFDTRTGPKLKEDSYNTICQIIGMKAASILFISDHPGECDAALASGMKTRFCLREGNPHRNGGHHQVIHNLKEA